MYVRVLTSIFDQSARPDHLYEQPSAHAGSGNSFLRSNVSLQQMSEHDTGPIPDKFQSYAYMLADDWIVSQRVHFVQNIVCVCFISNDCE